MVACIKNNGLRKAVVVEYHVRNIFKFKKEKKTRRREAAKKKKKKRAMAYERNAIAPEIEQEQLENAQ